MRLLKTRMLELLEMRKMNITYLAKTLGISKQYLSQVLSGHKKLSFNRTKQMIELFGADNISFVIDWDGMGIKNPLARPV